MAGFLKRHFTSLALAGILALSSFFSFQHLGQFITADEHYWVYERIPQYWEAIAEGKWKKTLINDKPGVTVALVAGPGLFVTPHPLSLCSETPDRVITCDTAETEKTLLVFRLHIIAVNALLLLYLFWIVRKITNRSIALWSTTFIALSPILIGMTQIINPDALLWSFGSAAFFSYLAMLRYGEKKYVFLSGMFLGLAILSKYTGSILIPFFLLTTILSLLTTHTALLTRAKQVLIHFFITLAIALGVIIILLPAIWLKPDILLDLLSGGSTDPLIIAPLLLALALTCDAFFFQGRTLFLMQRLTQYLQKFRPLPFLLPWGILLLSSILIIGRTVFSDWRLFATVPFDIKDLTSTHNGQDVLLNFSESLLLEMNPLIFSLPLIVLISFSFLLWCLPSLRQSERPWYGATIATFLFIPVFILALIFLDVLATPRYLILLYPLVAYLAACGLWEAVDTLKKTRLFSFPLFTFLGPKTTLTLFIIFCSVIAVVSSQPFYLNYTSPLLPKSELISDAWGYGGYEAAQYLNALPNAENLLVWTDYEGVCEFFVGKCLVKQYKYSSKQAIDYAVLTRRGKILYNPDHSRWMKADNLFMKPAYDDPNPEWQLLINNRPENFIKVVKVDNTLDATIITDIDHCPSRSAVSEELLQSFITFSQMKQTDFIVSLGDNASHRLRDCSMTGDADARYIADRLRSSGLPTHFALGDHDISSSVTSYQAWLKTIDQRQTYYSFDKKGVHIIILDTVLGGDPLQVACSDHPRCAETETRLTDIKGLSFQEYRDKYPDASPSLVQELRFVTSQWEAAKADIALTRSFGNRDRGRIGADELAWLEADITETSLDKILIFSDHPLFPFTSDKKRYDIVDGEKVRAILERSDKEVVAISGEAHLWHEETLNGVRYYIVDEFRKQNGSWAYFSWDENGFQLEQITH